MTRPENPPAQRRRRRRLTAILAVLGVVALGVVGAAAVRALVSANDAAPLPSAEATLEPTTPEPTTEPEPGPEPEATPEPEPTPEPTPEPGPVFFTIVAAGDVLPHDTVLRRASEAAAAQGADGWDFSPLWAPMDAWVQGADLALCHLEVPLIPDADTPSGYPVFGSPRSLAQDIADAGWDGCSTASNHSVDRGKTGLITTLDAFDAAGLGHVGTARTAEEASAPQVYVLEREGREIRVAQLSATYGTNGLPIPADMPWSVQLIDTDQLIGQAAAARGAGADLVVASIHWGTEYQDSPDSSQRRVAEALAASGVVDLVIGHHPHVPQPFELLPGGPDGAGMWVAYSLGNYISNQDADCCRPQTGTGLLLTATVEALPEGPPHVVGLEWTGVPGDRIGEQRIYALPDLEQGRIDAPLLTLSAEELANRRQWLEAVVGDAPERTEPPVPTGPPAIVLPRP